MTAGRGRLVCVANQKGGVAKTTTSVNLAAALALRGHRVLVVDVDPQANATTGLGIDHRSVELSTYDLMLGDTPIGRGRPPDDDRRPPLRPVVAGPGGGRGRARRGHGARASSGRRARDRRATSYDLIFLDCPPSLGLLTVNALAGAEDLIVPVQCEYYALEGLGPAPRERRARPARAQSRTSHRRLPHDDVRRAHEALEPGGR